MADRSRQNRPSRKARSNAARSGLLRRFTRAQEGAAAVEFAFIAIPFLVLVFSIFELGLVFLASMTLENALATVDRKIRTGEFQTSANNTQAAFRDAVCKQMSWLETSCPTAISLDVRVLPSFAGTKDLEAPSGATCWNPGGAGSIILVRGYYKWPVITPLLRSAVGVDGGGDRVISFANVFTNEPYNTDPVPKVTCPS
jgi:Flp pilus assembly protein TadG